MADVGSLRDELRGLIEPKETEQVSGSAALAAYARDVREAHQQIADRREAAAAAEAEEWSRPQGLAAELKAALANPQRFGVAAPQAQDDDPLPLNGQRLIAAAEQAVGGVSPAACESAADLIRRAITEGGE